MERDLAVSKQGNTTCLLIYRKEYIVSPLKCSAKKKKKIQPKFKTLDPLSSLKKIQEIKKQVK